MGQENELQLQLPQQEDGTGGMASIESTYSKMEGSMWRPVSASRVMEITKERALFLEALLENVSEDSFSRSFTRTQTGSSIQARYSKTSLVFVFRMRHLVAQFTSILQRFKLII
jgi:hypothetical protein